MYMQQSNPVAKSSQGNPGRLVHVNATGQPCCKVFPGQPWETRYLSYTKENRNQTTLMTCTGVHIVLVEINPEVWIGGLFSQEPCTVLARRLRLWQLPQCIFWGVAVIPSPIPSVSRIMPACIFYSSIYPRLPLWQCCDLGRKPRWSSFFFELLGSFLRRAHPRCPPMMNALTAREFWRWSCTAALRFNDTLISRTPL